MKWLCTFVKPALLALSIAAAAAEGYNEITSGFSIAERTKLFAQTVFGAGHQLQPQESKTETIIWPGTMILAIVVSDFSYAMPNSVFPTRQYRDFIKGIGDYEHVRAGISEDISPIASFWIRAPILPIDLVHLLKVLQKNSLIYTIDDGTGFFSETNTFGGNKSPNLIY